MAIGGQRRLRRQVVSAVLALGVVLLLAAGSAWVTTGSAAAAPGGGTGGYSGGGGGSKSGGGSTGGYSGGGGSSRRSTSDDRDSGSSGGSGEVHWWNYLIMGGALILMVVIFGFSYYRTKRDGGLTTPSDSDSEDSDWDDAGDRVTTRRAAGPRRSARQKREEQVEMAAVEASMEDAAFQPEAVKAATVALHKSIVEAWTARDRATLATLVGPDLMVEWNRRLDDFDRKGWHNITERLGDPTVEYLGLVNREGDKDDRVTIRIEAPIRDYTLDANGEHLLRTDDSDETTTLPEYWTLGRHDDGSWFLVSIEQDAEGSHVLSEDIVARPDADTARLHDEAVAEVAVAGAVPDEQVKDLTPVSFDGDARAAALDMANIDGRFDPDVLEASARRAMAAWAEAVDGDDVSLSLIASQGAIDELLYAGDASKHTRLVVRGPVLKSLHITRIDSNRTPPTMTIEAEVTGRRYREDRDTTTVVEGSKDKERTFTEHWTMALDGNDKTPWRVVGASTALV